MRILILALSACVAGSAVAQSVPTSGHAFPAGGAAGSTFTARLSGTDWTPDVRFVSHDSRVRIEPLGPPGPVLVPLPPYWLAPKSSLNDPGLPREVEARITLSADLPEGPVRWRAVNACGSKGSGLFMVGRGHEMIENESTTGPRKLDRLPVTVSGRLGRIEETDVYAFTASRTGVVVVELFARRLGSDFNGVLEARDSTGRVLAECADTSGRDAVLAFDAKRFINPSAVVDLPEPDSPTMASTCPACTSKFISIAAGYQTPSTQNSTVKFSTFNTGSVITAPGFLH